MKREDAIEYVAYYVDDALSTHRHQITDKTRLVVWECGFGPCVVAVSSYLNVRLDDGEAEELAYNYLAEIGWLSERLPADHVF